jgi:glucan phosphoethanolaminetransferase (alkaline phosphatase superfamily)
LRALIFSVAFNRSVYGSDPWSWSEVYRLAIFASATGGLFVALSFRRGLFAVAVPILWLLSAAVSTLTRKFGLELTENVAALAFETNMDETRGVWDGWVSLAAVLGLVTGLAMGSWGWRRLRPDGVRRKAVWIVILWGLVALLPKPDRSRGLQISAYPFNLAFAAFSYGRDQWRLGAMPPRSDLGADAQCRGCGDRLVVMVIGETVRFDHLGFNGYARGTTPRLQQRGVVSLGRVESCDTVTRISVPCMLTRATPTNLEPIKTERSLVTVFRHAGFATTWISNQARIWDGSFWNSKEFMNTLTTALASEAEQVVWANRDGEVIRSRTNDGTLLQPFASAAREPGVNLIVVHMIGSHWHYDSHYPEAFKQFQPTCADHDARRCSEQAVINSYDNTLVYTDFILSEFIDAMRDRDAILFFASDHGESLFEDGRVGHFPDSTQPEQRAAGGFVWMSPRFRERMPEAVTRLQRAAARSVSHDQLFHSVLDCAGIESEVVDRTLSVCADPPIR